MHRGGSQETGDEVRDLKRVLQSFCLPPDDRRNTPVAYAAAIGEGEEPLYVGCDLNLQIHNPRNDDEQDDAMRLCDAWQRRGQLAGCAGAPHEVGWASQRRA